MQATLAYNSPRLPLNQTASKPDAFAEDFERFLPTLAAAKNRSHIFFVQGQ
jgi:hypothetical protein